MKRLRSIHGEPRSSKLAMYDRAGTTEQEPRSRNHGPGAKEQVSRSYVFRRKVLQRKKMSKSGKASACSAYTQNNRHLRMLVYWMLVYWLLVYWMLV